MEYYDKIWDLQMMVDGAVESENGDGSSTGPVGYGCVWTPMTMAGSPSAFGSLINDLSFLIL